MPSKPSRAARAFERRMFLKAVALGMSVPAAARLARVATAAPTAAPKRFFLFYTPHGTAPEHYAPKVTNPVDPTKQAVYTDFALDQTNVSILGPLQPYKQYVNVYQGFQYPERVGTTHEGIVNCLSGVLAADGGGVTDTTTPRTTIDQLIGKALGIKPLILGACSHQPYGLDNHGMLFWDGTPIDPQKSPVKAADTLFGGGSNSNNQPVNADVQLRKDLLAFTASEIDGLQKTLSSLTREQTKLATHLAAIQSLQADSMMMMQQSSCTTKPTLPTVEMVRGQSAGNVPDPSGGNDYFYQAANFPLILQAQLEVITQAIICNAAPIIGLMPLFATCDFDFSFAGAPGSHHTTLSHTVPQWASGAAYNSPLTIANLDPASRAPFATAQKWFTTQLVNKVVSVLATTDDPAAPGTKVLDNTLIFWMSEVGDGQDHNRVSEVLYPQVPDSLPLVTIGKCGGAIKSGQVIQYPIAPKDNNAAAMVNRKVVDLMITLARAMGASSVSMPGQTGPVTEVLA
jgi:Protein of unknown function (DUF1552)